MSISEQLRSDSELTEEEKEARFKEQWDHVMGGLDRAVTWVKGNVHKLRKGFSLRLDRKDGICIDLGMFWPGDKSSRIVQRMFSGKQATRTKCSDHIRFTVRDEDLALNICWEEYQPRNEPKTVTEEVTL